jgi:hypothetical protein
MRFEWDEDKRQANLRKHRIDFVGVEEVFDGYTVTVEDDRFLRRIPLLYCGDDARACSRGRSHRARGCDTDHLDT